MAQEVAAERPGNRASPVGVAVAAAAAAAADGAEQVAPADDRFDRAAATPISTPEPRKPTANASLSDNDRSEGNLRLDTLPSFVACGMAPQAILFSWQSWSPLGCLAIQGRGTARMPCRSMGPGGRLA